MYSAPTIALKYLAYVLKASNGRGHGIHSPFVYGLVNEVLRAGSTLEAFAAIEAERSKLFLDKALLPVVDFGAGSRVGNSPEKRVDELARYALKPPKYARLLHHLLNYLQAKTVLEIGTSLGITTCYMATADHVEKVYSLEGSPAVAERATGVFSSLEVQEKISLYVGEFSQTLPKVLTATNQFDLIFMDGNHRYQPTVDYWQMIQTHLHTGSVVVLDDIHWSAEMESAWHWIKDQPQVTLTVDLFFVGLVFFNPDFKVKQHFTIRH